MLKSLEMDSFLVIDRGITYRIEEVEEGGYFGEIVGLEACLTDGLSLEETINNLREVLSMYLDVAREEGLSIPEEIMRALIDTPLSA